MVNILGCTFARGGSKGVPGKNIRMLCGQPLIGYAINAARASRFLPRQIVSTDSPEIAAVARSFGAEVPFLRPAYLATDTVPERLAWRHAITTMEELEGTRVDVLVSVPPTCPLRDPSDIDRCVEMLLESDADIVVTATEAACNPYFSMISFDDSGLARLAVAPEGLVTRRQDAPAVYDLTAVAYAARRDSVLRLDSIFHGRVKAVIIPRERAVDIDSQLDFDLAELLLQRRAAVDSGTVRLRRAA
ncbi:MAG TPA: acylneuraminate cytidylyltransferase family protein [Planctomycetaceae bacterium]|nr:acylneuraminate cytidylyltransferase family protein [Planctomycetaceae bacterium]HRA87199.1 acylneuraminate cytidylyltransferase family protein [Planctomycetaceae bacterium]